METQDYYKLIEDNKDIRISKSVKFAVAWWADRMDGTIDTSKENIDRHLEELPDSFKNDPKKWEELHRFIYCIKTKDRDIAFISKAQSEVLRKNLSILTQLEVNSRPCCLLSSDGERAWGILGLACFLSGIDHDHLLSLPTNVDMFVDENTVDIRVDDEKPAKVFVDERQATATKTL